MTERLHFHFSLSCLEEGNGNPLQCSCLENPRDGGARWAAVCGVVAQSQTQLSNFTFTFHFHALKKEMATRSSVLERDLASVAQDLAFCCTFYSQLHAAAAAKLLQSCPTLCDPIDGSPPGSPIPGILQARTLEWVAISFCNA